MKRAASTKPGGASAPASKRKREAVPEYESQAQQQDEHGNPIWPAPQAELENARRIILECAEKKETTIIVPDKDADGLSSARILYMTLVKLGLPQDKIHPHILSKGVSVHDESETQQMSSLNPSYLFVVDQGSRPSPPLIKDSKCTTLIIDHHFATPTDFPEGSQHVNACNSPPVATSALLTYEICKPLDDTIEQDCAWLCALGTHGDLGGTLKWDPPFPDMKATFKQYSKKSINDAVSLINAPRRTSAFNVHDAWSALLAAETPAQLLKNPTLLSARDEVSRETERCTHTPPQFSRDASVAIMRISSRAQVHPLIATRWSSFLASKKLKYVMVANEGYIDNKINFSCRPTRAAKVRGEEVNIIELLKEAARLHTSGDLLERMGHSFARGHVQASGGIVDKKEFEDLMQVLGEGEGNRGKNSDGPGDKSSPKKGRDKPVQKNTLGNYFSKSSKEVEAST